MVKPATKSLERLQRGFTLMELMVVLAIVAIALSLAVPSLRDFMRNSRLTSASNDLLAALNLARSEAVKRQIAMPGGVAVCATSNPDAIPPVCSGSWAAGASSAWVVWVDANGNWAPDNNANEPVLQRHEALDGSVSLRSDNDGIVKYVLTGFSATAGTKTPTRNVVMCDARGTGTLGNFSKGRAVLISATGRARVSKMPTDVSNAVSAAGACP